MTLFNEIKNKVTQTAKSAMQKSNEIFEITKINMSIGDAQLQMDKLFRDVGKIIYDAYREGDQFSDEITKKCSQVDNLVEQIKEMKERVAQLKKVKICPNCESENQPDAVFCSKCGRKIEHR